MEKSTATLKSILAGRMLRYSDLAQGTGLSSGTIENIACGASKSKRGRRKIESFLGASIWPEEQDSTSAPVTPGDSTRHPFTTNEN